MRPATDASMTRSERSTNSSPTCSASVRTRSVSEMWPCSIRTRPSGLPARGLLGQGRVQLRLCDQAPLAQQRAELCAVRHQILRGRVGARPRRWLSAGLSGACRSTRRVQPWSRSPEKSRRRAPRSLVISEPPRRPPRRRLRPSAAPAPDSRSGRARGRRGRPGRRAMPAPGPGPLRRAGRLGSGTLVTISIGSFPGLRLGLPGHVDRAGRENDLGDEGCPGAAGARSPDSMRTAPCSMRSFSTGPTSTTL